MSSFTAVLATQHDGKFQVELEQMERSALPAGEVLIRVEYSSLNYKDGAVLKGWPGFIRKWPMVPGIDGGFPKPSGAAIPNCAGWTQNILCPCQRA